MIRDDRAPSAATTAIAERRLIRDAKCGDRVAEARLIAVYEPMARYIATTHFMPGGEREDLAQQARIGILSAIHAWDASRHVPFRSFAWLCAVREARMAVSAARAGKHQPLNDARSLPPVVADVGHALEEMLEATGRPDTDPVAKTLAREHLREILARARTLTDLERGALALSANDLSHHECASRLSVGERAVNNALQRARRKLRGPVTAHLSHPTLPSRTDLRASAPARCHQVSSP